MLLSTLVFSSVAAAQAISLHEQPNTNAKIIGTADLSTGIIPVYTPPNSEWIKIADPRNGNVGWVKNSDLKSGTSNSVTFTQKIISNGSQPGTYTMQFGNQPANANQEQMKEYLKKIQDEQKIMQQSFQNMLKNVNEMFQKEWGFWSTQQQPVKDKPAGK